MPPKKKKISKLKKISSSKNSNKKQTETLPKLPRGFKQCINCSQLLYIRKLICTNCKFQNKMKKKQISTMDLIQNKTAKSLCILLEANQMNRKKNMQIESVVKQISSSQPVIVNNKNSIINQQKISVEINNKIKHIIKNSFQMLSENFVIFASSKPIKCIRLNNNFLIFVQEEMIEAQDISQHDQITIKAHKIEKFHKIGHKYRGTSYIYLSEFPYRKIEYRMRVQKNIIQIQPFKSLLAVLCGDGSVVIYQCPIKTKNANKTLILNPQIEIESNNYSAITWLTQSNQPALICGDYAGNLYVFELLKKQNTYEQKCVRCIINAHNGYITTIKQCPLNDSLNILFASGAYDGYVKIWNVRQTYPIYQQEVSNRKISNILWDAGAKFLLVQRDDNYEGCILISLFSTIKQNNKLSLMKETQIRYLKEFTTYGFSSIDYQSQYCVLASESGKVDMCQMQNLRKLSIKKKKRKTYQLVYKNFQIYKQQDGRIVINKSNSQSKKSHHDEISEQQQQIQQQKPEFKLDKNLELNFKPFISDVSYVLHKERNIIAISSFEGIILIYNDQYKEI